MKNKFRKAVEQMIIDNGPYNNMTTITYKHQLLDEEIIQSTNTLIHFLNRKLFGTRYRENETYLEGIVIAERQIKRANNDSFIYSKLKSGAHSILRKFHKELTDKDMKRMIDNMSTPMLHFHILFKENPIFETKDFETILYSLIKKVNKISFDGNPFRVLSKEGVDVRPVDNIKGLADYLTKTIKRDDYRLTEIFEEVNADGVNFISYYGWCSYTSH